MSRPKPPGPAPLRQPLKTMADLARVQKALELQAARAREEAARLAREAQIRQSQNDLFRVAAGTVQPLADRGRRQLKPSPPLPIPRQRERDDAAALAESLSDEVDISSLLDTDDQLSFRRPGIGTDVTRKLRRGIWALQRQVDLHGMRSDEAREALGAFIRDAHRDGLRCVRVVHGKGLGSPGRAPVLKDKVYRWLAQKNEVLAFVQAPPHQGGAGALLVLLQPSGKPI